MIGAESIAWVRPPEPIRGLDCLGVQAPRAALGAQLLPGITNVTDPVRYYPFHPWVIWSFEKRYRDHSLDKFPRQGATSGSVPAPSCCRKSQCSEDTRPGRMRRRPSSFAIAATSASLPDADEARWSSFVVRHQLRSGSHRRVRDGFIAWRASSCRLVFVRAAAIRRSSGRAVRYSAASTLFESPSSA